MIMWNIILRSIGSELILKAGRQKGAYTGFFGAFSWQEQHWKCTSKSQSIISLLR